MRHCCSLLSFRGPACSQGDGALKIYFESEENKQEYLNITVHGSDDMSGMKNIYDEMADNPNTGSIN
jgi:hypothetical protein